MIPKGWPIKGMKLVKSAAREAFKEAGIVGKVAKTPIGAYAYDKRLRNGRLQHVRVAVFALCVGARPRTIRRLASVRSVGSHSPKPPAWWRNQNSWWCWPPSGPGPTKA